MGFKPVQAHCCDACLLAEKMCFSITLNFGGLGSQFILRITGLCDLGVIQSLKCFRRLCATFRSASVLRQRQTRRPKNLNNFFQRLLTVMGWRDNQNLWGIIDFFGYGEEKFVCAIAFLASGSASC